MVQEFIKKLFSQSKLYIFFYSLCFGLITLVEVIEPSYLQKTIDVSLYNYNKEILFKVAFIWLFLFCAKYVLDYLISVVRLKYVIKVYKKIEQHLATRILKAKPSSIAKVSPSLLASLQLDDGLNLEGIFPDAFIDPVFGVIKFIVISVMMFQISVPITIISIFLIVINILINSFLPLKKLYADRNKSLAASRSELENTYSGSFLIKISNKESDELTRINGHVKKYLDCLYKRDYMNLLRRLLNTLNSEIGTPIIVILGAFLVANNMITAGTITSLIVYYARLNSCIAPIFNFIPLLKNATASLERLRDIYDIEEDDYNTECKKIDNIDSIELKDVTFSYGDTNVLENINISAGKGKFVAFVGESGSGKSTIMQLLLKFITPKSGQILINGTDINNISAESLHDLISYVDQNAFLFNRSLYENIMYRSSGNENLENAKKYMHQFRLDRFYGSLENRKPDSLSVGERQRFCIIREFIKNSKLIILDEYTASLDSITEAEIQDELLKNRQDKIILMIAHRLSTVVNADVIYVIEKGKIVEYGSHQELLKKNGAYTRLYNKQSDTYQTAEEK